MSNLQEKFEQALEDVQQLQEKPDNETLLELYALFKQATVGQVSGKRPGFTDFKGRAKYDAWANLKDTSKEHAQESYVKLVERLQAN